MNAMFPALVVVASTAVPGLLLPVSWIWRLMVGGGTLAAILFTVVIHWRWDGLHTRFNPWWLVSPILAGDTFFLALAVIYLSR
jgi:hypothetical protein